jgi:hypothetical protein
MNTFIQNIKCMLGFHYYEIRQMIRFNGHKPYLVNHHRFCNNFRKQQSLQPTKHYTAGAYVWENYINLTKEK